MKDLIIIGAGGHTRPVIDVAFSLGYEVIGIIDVDYKGSEERIMGVEVIGGMDKLTGFAPDLVQVFIAIGDNSERQMVDVACNNFMF